MAAPIDVFISYAPPDEDLRKELDDHLAMMKRENLIRVWDQSQIGAGDASQATIERHLTAARVIVLLVSSSYIASDHHYDEMSQALERARNGNVRVMPVILRACDRGISFTALDVLPKNGTPITSWANRDEVWEVVVLGIRKAVERLLLRTGDEQFWRRRGSEAQAEDWKAGNRDPLTSAEAGRRSRCAATIAATSRPCRTATLGPKRASTRRLGNGRGMQAPHRSRVRRAGAVSDEGGRGLQRFTTMVCGW